MDSLIGKQVAGRRNGKVIDCRDAGPFKFLVIKRSDGPGTALIQYSGEEIERLKNGEEVGGIRIVNEDQTGEDKRVASLGRRKIVSDNELMFEDDDSEEELEFEDTENDEEDYGDEEELSGVEVEGIPAEVFEEYEAIRQSGVVNMFDREGVKTVAKTIGFKNILPYLKDSKTYSQILKNYSKAVEKGIIKREDRKIGRMKKAVRIVSDRILKAQDDRYEEEDIEEEDDEPKYQAVLFAPDGDWVTDFKGRTIDEVENKLAGRGSLWIFYPIEGIIRYTGSVTSPSEKVIEMFPSFDFLSGRTIKEICDWLKEHRGEVETFFEGL